MKQHLAFLGQFRIFLVSIKVSSFFEGKVEPFLLTRYSAKRELVASAAVAICTFLSGCFYGILGSLLRIRCLQSFIYLIFM